MTKTWLGLSIVGGLVCMLAAPAWPDYQAGRHAAKRGDYDTALKEWRPLVEKGNAGVRQCHRSGRAALSPGETSKV